MKISRTFYIVVFIICLFGTLACYQPEQSDIVAEAGGIIITKDEIAEFYMVKQYGIIETIIWEKILLLECKDRGIFLDADRYEEMMNGAIMQNGGKEAFKEMLGDMGLTLKDVSKAIKMQILDSQLLDVILGEPTDEEINAIWEADKEQLTLSFANDMKVSQSEVTKDDVMEAIIQSWQNNRRQEVSATYRDEVKEKWGVKNYFTGEGVEFTETVEETEEIVLLKGGGDSEAERGEEGE